MLRYIPLKYGATVIMQGEKRERWMQLCSQAATEQDPHKLMELVKEINQLLEEKERRLGILPEAIESGG